MQLNIAGYFQGKAFSRIGLFQLFKTFHTSSRPVVVISVLANNSWVKILLDSWKIFSSNNLLYSIHHPVKACHVPCMNSVFHCNINFCVFILSTSFAVPVEGDATIPNHIYDSRNPVKVTGEIYVILESVIKLPLLFL